MKYYWFVADENGREYVGVDNEKPGRRYTKNAIYDAWFRFDGYGCVIVIKAENYNEARSIFNIVMEQASRVF